MPALDPPAAAHTLREDACGLPSGLCLFVVGLPFYWLAWRRLRALFLLETPGLVAAISALADAVPLWP